MIENPTTALSTSPSKLIVIEGIPGSGKTTTAQTVHEWLVHHRFPSAVFLEGDWDHPADYESVACLSTTQYADLQAQFPHHTAMLARHASMAHGEWFVPYRQMQQTESEHLEPGLCEALARYDVYELPADHHQRVMEQRWRQFATQAASEERVYVFECCFLQNPLTTLLAKHDLPEPLVSSHMRMLAEIVAPLRPLVVYLAQHDVRATLEAIRAKRPREWADFVIDYLTSQTYGRRHGLSGFDGVVAFYAMRQAYELALLNTLPVQSLVLSNVDTWATRSAELATVLSEFLV